MDCTVSDRIGKADQIISNMNPKQRILFVRSDDRQMPVKLIDESLALRGRLKLEKGDTLAEMFKSGTALRLMDRYEDRQPFGRLMNRTTYLSKVANPAQQAQLQKKLKPDDDVRLFYIDDFEIIEDSLAARLLKAFLDGVERSFVNAFLVIGSSENNLPKYLSEQVCLLQLGSPSQQEIFCRLEAEVRSEQDRRKAEKLPVREVSAEQLNKYAAELSGLTTTQLESVYAMLQDRYCTAMDSRLQDIIWEQKRLEGEKDAGLEFMDVSEDPRIVGVGRFNQWLNDRVADLADPKTAKANGTPAPKGVLLFGVPGTGKTQLARLMAYRWSKQGNSPVSLLKFNIGNLSSRNYGENEKLMDRYLNRIGANAPGIMFIDEIEKIFHKDMHEVKAAQMSYLLSWAAQDHGNIVSFYTANSVEDIPPELIRDGRISARFFVFLPNAYDLTEIIYTKLFSIRKRLEKNFSEEIWEMRRLMKYAANGEVSSEELKKALSKSSQFKVLEELGKWAEKENRTPFMTGANVETLLELAFRSLRKEGIQLKECNADCFAKKLKECCCTTTFNPEGQSSLSNIVKIYLQGKKFEYEDISDPDRALLPFYCFGEDGLFDQKKLPKPDNAYDKRLQKVLIEKLEEPARKRIKEEKLQEAEERYRTAMIKQAEASLNKDHPNGKAR